MQSFVNSSRLVLRAIVAAHDLSLASTIGLVDSAVEAVQNQSQKKSYLIKLEQDLAETIQAELAKPHFDNRPDLRALLPQMLEASVPNAATLVNCNLDVDEIFAAMLAELKKGPAEHQDHAALTEFDRFVRPLLKVALSCAEFVDELKPLINAVVLKRLQFLVDQAQSSQTLSYEARELARQQELIWKIAENFLAEIPNDPIVALVEIERTLEDYAEQVKARAGTSNLDEDIKTTLEVSEQLVLQGKISSALEVALQAESNLDKVIDNARKGQATLIARQMVLHRLSNDHVAYAYCEARLLELQMQEQPSPRDLAVRGAVLQVDFAARGSIFEGRVAAQVLRNALSLSSPEHLPHETIGQLATCQALLGEKTGNIEYFDDAIALIDEFLLAVPAVLSPSLHAFGRDSLGSMQRDKSKYLPGGQKLLLLAETIDNYKAAISLLSQSEERARIINNLAHAQSDMFNACAAPQKSTHFEAAINNFQVSRDEYGLFGNNLGWAMAEGNIGLLLYDWVRNFWPNNSIALLKQSSDRHKSAIQKLSKEEEPLEWANIHNSLGNSLRVRASIPTCSNRLAVLRESADAFGACLEVYSKEDHPLDWANAIENLGNTLGDLALATANELEAEGTFEKALDALRQSLNIHTRENLPARFARNTMNIAATEYQIGTRGLKNGNRAKVELALGGLDECIEILSQFAMEPELTSALALKARITEFLKNTS